MAALQLGNSVVTKNSDAVGLKLWIFKLVWDEFAVCVEGYRAKDEGELELCNWRSTPVVQRISSRVLLTRSGTKYVLQGIIDEESVLALGYPRILVDQFKDGFPPNWNEVLHQYHYSFTKNNPLNSSQWFIMSTICASKGDSAVASQRTSTTGAVLGELQSKEMSHRRSSALLARRGHHDVAAEKIIEEEEQEGSARSESSQLDKPAQGNGGHDSIREQTCEGDEPKKLNGKVLGTANEVFKVPQLPTTTKRSLPVVRLYNWTVLFSISDLGSSTLFRDFGLVIEGYREAEQCDWKTSCIVAVRDNRHIETASTAYELAGPINTMVAAQQGYPKEFVTHFLDGFPEDWHAVISRFFTTYVKPHIELEQRRRSAVQPSQKVAEGDSGAWSENDAFSATSESEENDVDTKPSRKRNLARSLSSSDVDGPIKSSKMKPSRASDGASKRTSPKALKTSSTGLSSKEPTATKKKSSAQMIVKGRQRRSDEKEGVVRTSRSGRVLKRPLARWAGERIVYDVNGEPVKAVGITTESIMTSRGGNETSAVVNHLGLSPLPGPVQQEKGSFDLPVDRRRKQRRTRRRPLVTYSSSSPSESDEDYTHNAHEPPTPFHGKPHKQTWHVIQSSPEEEEEREVGNRRVKKRRQKGRKKSLKGRGVVKKRSTREIPTRQIEKEKQIVQPINDKVDSVEINAASDDHEGSTGETEFCASDGGTPERVEVEEGDLQVEQYHVPKRWKRDEIDRLKLAVRAIKPRDESDWVKVANSLGGRDADDCLAEAQKRLGWKPQKRLTRMEEERELEELACAAGKAKVGTISYQVKAQRFTRKYVMAGGESDFFEDTMDLGASSMMRTMPSVVQFDPDDSLLDVVRTPGAAEVKHANRREFIPDLASSSESLPGPSRLSPSLFAIDSAERDRRERYVHRLLKNRSYNTSRLNNSSMNASRACARRNYKLNLPSSAQQIGEVDEVDEDNDDYFSSDDNN